MLYGLASYVTAFIYGGRCADSISFHYPIRVFSMARTKEKNAKRPVGPLLIPRLQRHKLYLILRSPSIQAPPCSLHLIKRLPAIRSRSMAHPPPSLPRQCRLLRHRQSEQPRRVPPKRTATPRLPLPESPPTMQRASPDSFLCFTFPT